MTAQPFSAHWLMRQKFPPLAYVIPGLIPEGLTTLNSAPKIGKSWMVLGIAYALSTGQNALGAIPTGTPRPVLYLALEDGQRRLQDRLRVIGADDAPHDLEFVIDLGDEPAASVVNRFFDHYRDRQPVAIIDTLQKARAKGNPDETQYANDYRDIGALKAVTDGIPGSSLILVHHTRKAAAADFLDAVSGTQGIAGAADSILVLTRDRNKNAGTLYVTSRDADEGEYRLKFENGCWSLDGDDLPAAALAAQTARATENTGENMTALVEFVNTRQDGVRAADVADALNVPEGTARQLLKRAFDAERIEKADRGLYTPVTNVTLSRPQGSSESRPPSPTCSRCQKPNLFTSTSQDRGYCESCARADRKEPH